MARRSSNTTEFGVAEIADADVDELHLEQFLTYRLNVLSNMLNRQMERFLKPKFGVSLPDWRVLANLGRFHDMSIRDVAARSQMDKALASRVVARLIKRGMVNSRPDSSDGRLVVLSVTAKGQELYEAIMPLARKRQQRLLECLGGEEQVALDQALNKLILAVRDSELHKSEADDTWWR